MGQSSALVGMRLDLIIAGGVARRRRRDKGLEHDAAQAPTPIPTPIPTLAPEAPRTIGR